MDQGDWHTKNSPLITRWAQDVKPDAPWPEYPRPQMVRERWLNLNGLWEYAITPSGAVNMGEPSGAILVPYPLESALSRVQTPLSPKSYLWYRRTFQIPGEWHDKHILLHFGAVDWEAAVFINQQLVGTHRGGYTPFSFDIAPYIDRSSANEIVVRVWDPTDRGKQPIGKQRLHPAVVFYTAVSGIWQTVWIEPIHENGLEVLDIIPDIDQKSVRLAIKLYGAPPGDPLAQAKNYFQLKATVSLAGREFSSRTGPLGAELVIPVDDLRLWSPESPTLYGLAVEVLEGGQPIDVCRSYFGMRKFSLGKDEAGHTRFMLNNAPYFLMGVLDQGYWPGGLYTAPTIKGLESDVALLKKCGYNMVRKHLKVEPLVWYHLCDQQGLIVIQDMPNGGGKAHFPFHHVVNALNLKLNDTKHYWLAGYGKGEARAQFEQELGDMIVSLRNVPSIAIWCPFNEAWGQFDSSRIAGWIKERDPARLVDAASGWYDFSAGDFVSIHDYRNKFRVRPGVEDRAVLLSETGGYTYPVAGHRWHPRKMFGYRQSANSEELLRAYGELLAAVITPAVQGGLSGFVYTQLADVEIEYNGLVTYDRAVTKIGPESLSRLHRALAKRTAE